MIELKASSITELDIAKLELEYQGKSPQDRERFFSGEMGKD